MSLYCEQPPKSTSPWTDASGSGRAPSARHRATSVYGATPDYRAMPGYGALPEFGAASDIEALPDYELAPPRPDERLAPSAQPDAVLHDTLLLSPPQTERFLPPPRPEDRISGAPRAADRPPYLPPAPAPRPPFLPEDRPAPRVSTPDLRRLDIQAALTAAGVAPVTGDSAAVHQIAHLDEATVTAVISWIGAAAQGSERARPRPF
ncbi:hypothetical protein [Streptomyces sp. NPDC101393]|uniref:hypothetical protein n=1 Tax=Streptomyces sp. NPDC101393 TaxID=3366141 RepID=UPI00382EC52F